MTSAAPGRLVRDRLTVTLYGAFVMWGWFLYGFSPAVPLIQSELGVSRALAGLHGTALAVGTVLAGLVTSTVAVRLGRRLQVAIGCTLVVAGVAALLAGSTLVITLPAVLVTAIGGNFVISAAQPALALHHGWSGPAAVTEANAVGASIGLLAPLAVGTAVALGWGWRPAVGLTIVLAVALGALVMRLAGTGALGRGSRGRRAGTPHAADAGADLTAGTDVVTAGDGARGPWFPRTFWFFWAAMLCGVAIEFATTFWAADLVGDRTGAGPAIRTAAVSALVLGMAVSRFVIGPLSLRKSPEKLLLVAYAVAGAGFAVLWTATHPAVAVVGLVLAGLGYGGHYPLAVALVLRASGGRPDQAQATSTVGTGLAVAVAPFALGALADAHGPHLAFLLVPALLAVGFTAVALGLRSVRRDMRTAEPAPA